MGVLNFGGGIDESEATWVLLLLKMKRENVLFKVTVWYSLQSYCIRLLVLVRQNLQLELEKGF